MSLALTLKGDILALPMPPANRPFPIAEQVRHARDGDNRALRSLYDAHINAVYGYCLRFCRGDAEQARDLTQEAFTKAFASLSSLREPAAFPGWLMQITRRACLRWIERNQREQTVLEAYAQEPPPARSADQERLAAAVAELIERCPDEGQRQAAALFYRPPPHSTQQIADALGLSRTAVTTRLHRFRVWVRRRMLKQLADAMEEGP